MKVTYALIDQCKQQTMRQWPAFAGHMARLEVKQANVRDDMGHPTLGVDDRLRLYFNPEADFEPKHLVSILAHEVYHVAVEHPLRRKSGWFKNSAAWALAIDCEVNDDLRADGAEFPPGAVFPEQFGLPEGLSAEQYYYPICKILEEKAEKEKDKDGNHGDPGETGGKPSEGAGDSAGQGEPGDSQQGGSAGNRPEQPSRNDRERGEPDAGSENGNDAAGEGAGGAPDADDSSAEGTDSESAASGSGDSGEGQDTGPVSWGGSGQDGERREWEDQDDPLDAIAQQEVQRINEQAADSVRDQVEINEERKRRGWSTTGKGQNVAINIVARHSKKQSAWHSRLRAVVGSAVGYKSGPQDYSYKRLSRREPSHPDIVRPGMIKFRPNILCIWDVSGSMDEGDLKAGVGEAAAVAPYGDVWAVPWNHAQAGEPVKVDASLRSRKLPSGGGTNMMDAIHWAFNEGAQHTGKKPDLVIVLSDGDCTWDRDYKPPKPVILGWIQPKGTHDEWHKARFPKWLQVIEIESGS